MPLLQLAGPGLSPLADPDPLPPAPFLERYFLQDPVPTAIFLCIAAAIGWWWLQRVGKPKASWIVAAACPLLAGVVLLLARFVVTEREALVTRCTELVKATIATRAAEVEPFLRSDATASVPKFGLEYKRDQLLPLIRDNEPLRRGATEAGLKWTTATIDGPNVGRTQCRVQVKLQEDFWLPTTWMIHWTRADAKSPWLVRRIEAQQIGLR